VRGLCEPRLFNTNDADNAALQQLNTHELSVHAFYIFVFVITCLLCLVYESIRGVEQEVRARKNMSTASPAANFGPRSLVEAAKVVSMPQFKTQSSELRRVHRCIGQDCDLF
jgi:hypothetical protein